MLVSRASAVRIARRSFATVVESPGLKVAAIDTAQPTVSVTFLAKAGPRYQQKQGVAHALKNFAFKGTEERSALATVREAELLGGVLSSTLSREHLALTAEFLRGDEAFFVDLLASVVASTQFTRHEFQELVLPAIEGEVNSLAADPATHAVELAHALAFRSGLGASLFAAPHTPITAGDVAQFASTAFSSDIAVLGTGISQSALSALVTKSLANPAVAALASPASQYFGGETRLQAHGTPQTLFIGFGAAGVSSPELAALAAFVDPTPAVKWSRGSSPMLQHAGTSVRVVYLPYSDATLLGLVVQGPTTDAVREAGKAAVAALKGSATVKAEDLKSAIAKAKFRLASAADGRAGTIEILGSKVLAGLNETSLDASLAALDKVSVAGFSKIATNLLKAKPTFVAIGDTHALPYADELGL
ncbi:Metalloenzyme, LuxS/M16 peptidase-like protein [Mycena rebaudengoi]|nr:Metalloenzyme, LuxS/M16 peptidase-like protein [Mycena rebaudengoi]